MYTSRLPDISKRNMGDTIVSGVPYKKEPTPDIKDTSIDSRKNSTTGYICERKEEKEEKENDEVGQVLVAETNVLSNKCEVLLIDELTKRVGKLEDIISKFVAVLEVTRASQAEEPVVDNKSMSEDAEAEVNTEVPVQEPTDTETKQDEETEEEEAARERNRKSEEEYLEGMRILSEKLVNKLHDEIYKFILPSEHMQGISFNEIKLVQFSEMDIMQSNLKREIRNSYKELKENHREDIDYLKNLIKSSLAPFVTKEDYSANYDKVEAQLEVLSTNLEDVSQKTSDEFATINERFDQMSQVMEKKAEESDLDKLWNNMEKSVDYGDLKELYSKVMPPIKKFEDLAGKLEKEREEIKEGVKKVEGFLAEYKVSYFQDGQKVENVAKFVTTSEINALVKEIEKRFFEQKTMIDTLKSVANKDWECAKSNRVFNLESLRHECEVKKEEMSLMRQFVESKMDKIEAPSLEAIKVDQFQSMRFYEFVKKQQQCILLLLTDFMKTALKNRKETEEARINRRVHLISQANSLAKWLANADQPSASSKAEDSNNVLFSPKGIEVPKELKQFNKRVDEVYKTLNSSRHFTSQQATHFDSSVIMLETPFDSPKRTFNKDHKGLLNKTLEFDKVLLRDSPQNKHSKYVSLYKNMTSNSGVTLIRDPKHSDAQSPSKLDKLNLPKLYY